MQGETRLALKETESALGRFPPGQVEWHLRFKELKAEILHSQGADREALSLLAEELPPSLADSELAVRTRLTQAAANLSIQEFPAAEGFLRQAEQLAAARHPELLGEVHLKKGTFFFLKGELPSAEVEYSTAQKLGRGANDRFLEASALSGLGVVATAEGHYDESVDRNRAALELSRALGARSLLANLLGNLGWSYVELGDYETALSYYKEAEQEAAKDGQFADQTYWLGAIAYVDHGLGEYQAAESVLQQALRLARAQDDQQTLGQCLTQLAALALQSGRPELALQLNREASGIPGLGLRLQSDTIFLKGEIAAFSGDYRGAEAAFQEILLESGAPASLKWQAHANLAKIYADKGLRSRAETEFRLSLESIESVRSRVRGEELRLSFLFSAITFYDQYIEFLMSQGRSIEALRVAESSRSGTLTEGLVANRPRAGAQGVGFKPRQIAARAKAVLLFYWLGKEHSYLWVISPHQTSVVTLPEESQLGPVVNAYKQTVLKLRDPADAGSEQGKQLFTLLVEPALKWIPSGARVILLPSESLYGLNFETLIVTGPRPHFWIEDVTLSTASSLTLLDHAQSQDGRKQGNVLLVGDTLPNAEFEALPQAATEMQKVEDHFPATRRVILERKLATPSAYLESHPERFSFLHFVTHATASRSRPLESAVILSPEGGSYKLYAREILQHHLNANLVTISACSGSGIRTYSGEGLVGLSWAFLRAGAHNVIGALWEVSDSSTPQLMDSLYRELSEGKDPATALRSAKLSLLQSMPDTVFRKPFYWAPFQLYTGS